MCVLYAYAYYAKLDTFRVGQPDVAYLQTKPLYRLNSRRDKSSFATSQRTRSNGGRVMSMASAENDGSRTLLEVPIVFNETDTLSSRAGVKTEKRN